ncbi:MAG: hypothetical protein ACYC2W_05555 [Desulfurivibrionaceae bacterium]
MDKLKLYAPLIASIALMLLALKAEFGSAPFVTISRLGFDIVLTRNLAGKIMFIAGALSLLSTYIYLDYSKFFPSHFEMEVFYDDKGIQNSLSVFTGDELNSLGYLGLNKDDVEEYYRSLDERLGQLLNYDGFFSVRDGIVHSKGQTSFKMQQTDGIHKYYIADSKGELAHTLERPGMPTFNFLSFFEKLSSPNDYVRPKILDLISKQEVILAPRFKQILAEKKRSDGVIFDHILVGVTKVYLVPYPRYSNTVYFIETKNSGVVPIGYAVYK